MNQTLDFGIDQASNKGWSGARFDSVFNGNSVAKKVWGAKSLKLESTFSAFAYLTRRFGPTIHGSDPHKDLAQYCLTTPNKEVAVFLSLGSAGLAYSLGYFASKELKDKIYEPAKKWEKDFFDWVSSKSRTKNKKRLEKKYFAWRTNVEKTNEAIKVIGAFPFENKDVEKDINDAVIATCKELLRPIFIRDRPFNLLGPLTDAKASQWEHVAEHHKFAGYGMPEEGLKVLEDWHNNP